MPKNVVINSIVHRVILLSKSKSNCTGHVRQRLQTFGYKRQIIQGVNSLPNHPLTNNVQESFKLCSVPIFMRLQIEWEKYAQTRGENSFQPAFNIAHPPPSSKDRQTPLSFKIKFHSGVPIYQQGSQFLQIGHLMQSAVAHHR